MRSMPEGLKPDSQPLETPTDTGDDEMIRHVPGFDSSGNDTVNSPQYGDVVPHNTGREVVSIPPEKVGPGAIKRAQSMLPSGQHLVRTEQGFSVVDMARNGSERED